MKRLNVDELIIEATRFCNLDCAHCCRGDATTEYMDPNTIRNIFENIGSINELVISGGEPLVALRQLRTIANCINYYDVNVDNILIISNGTILNERIINSLNDLKSLCNDFEILVSNDKFHQMSIERLGLIEKRNNNFKLLEKLYNASNYGSPEDSKGTVYYDAGRARNITKEELEEVNKWGSVETNYSIINPDYKYWYRQGFFLTYPHTGDDEYIEGVVDIDVDGYLVDMYVSYNEVKDYHNENVNINEVGLLNSIKNFSPYFNEVHENYKRLNKSKTNSRMN